MTRLVRGAQFEGWRVEAQLSASALWSTYAARRFGARGVLRVLSADAARSATGGERLRALGDVAAEVGHPGVVEVLDAGTSRSGDAYAIFEHAGASLLEAAAEHEHLDLGLEHAVRVVVGVLDVLTSAHARGVLHREVRPATIFATKEGVKIGNFGVAALRAGAGLRNPIGTFSDSPSFASPEEAMGLVDQLDERADLFSVGAVLRRMLGGARLHAFEREADAWVSAATTPVVPMLGTRPLRAEVAALAAIADRALSWDRRDRYPSAAEMKAALTEARGRG